MSSDSEVLKRLSDLECRLEKYHAHLEAALEHDRQFQMDATWGVATGVLSLGAMLVLLSTGSIWLRDAGWPWWIVGAALYPIAVIAAVGLIATWVEKKRAGDVAKLSRLPQWDAKDQ